MAYAAWSVVFGEQPSAAKWNILGTNDASFNDGTGIGNATITANKMALGGSTANVATSEATTSVTYVDLTTTTDTVTVTIGANGIALVIMNAWLVNNTNTAFSYLSYAVSGATTIAAADTVAQEYQAFAANGNGGLPYVQYLTGLAAGSTTFKMKYRVQAGTGTYSNRRIAVIPL